MKNIDIEVHIVGHLIPPATPSRPPAVGPPSGDGVFVWAAGEGSRATCAAAICAARWAAGEPAQLSGYWRRGIVAFDGDAPIDPFDLDE